MTPYIQMENITKRFASVLANDGVSLSVDRGEIVALLGENGSGKSTLVNMLAGIYIPDSGTITIDGKRRFFRSPQDAIAAGVGMVHQHFKLIPRMTAWENVSLGEKAAARAARTDISPPPIPPFPIPSPFINKKAIIKKMNGLESRFGLAIDPEKKIYDMSVSEKQTVEIVKMLYRGAKALILDEPTAVLTPQETERLFGMLRNMRDEGCAVIIITHKLNEVMDISDRVQVMRKGRGIGTVRTSATSPRELTEMMVGASVSLEIKREGGAGTRDAPLLEAEGLFLRDANGAPVLDGLSFSLYPGEILGVAGIAGSGQKELCEVIAGLRRVEAGDLRFKEKSILGLSPHAVQDRGVVMSFVPEDRLGMGLVAGMSVTDNVLLRSYEKRPGIFVDRNEGRALAEKIVRLYRVSTPSVRHMVRKLSGGNIQKVLLGREIERGPQALITAYPVRGLDIGASYSIYEMLNEQKRRGVGVLYIGEDLDVLRELCDRLMVIHNGKVMDVVDPSAVSKEEIGLLMLGHQAA